MISDVDYVIIEGMKLPENEAVDYIFSNLKELDDETILYFIEQYLEEEMQTSGQINTAIGKNRLPYETELVNI